MWLYKGAISKFHMGEKVFIEFLVELGRQFYEYSTESTELFA